MDYNTHDCQNDAPSMQSLPLGIHLCFTAQPKYADGAIAVSSFHFFQISFQFINGIHKHNANAMGQQGTLLLDEFLLAIILYT